MKRTTLKLASSTIIQLEAGEQKAIRDGGDLYICIQSEDGIEVLDDEPAKENSKPVAVAETAQASAPAETASAPKASAPAGQLTEAEMMDMETEELLDILDEMGIDPAKFEGKNTNKKIRLLILDGYKNGNAPAEAKPARASRAEETAEVADDTRTATAPARARRGAVAEEAPEFELITDWDSLKQGDLVLAKLKMDNEADSAKMWEAQVVGWDTPKGVKEEKLFVLFLEDDTEDFLREEDELYVYKKLI